MSSSSDSDKPRTSPPSSPIHRKTNSRSTVAASRIPRLRATSFTSRPFSPPSTPIDTAKSEPLDWGSAGEWRRLSGSTKQDSAEMDPDLDEGGALLAERADDCQVAPTSPSTVAKIVTAQSVTVSSGLFGDDGSNFSELEQLSSYGESEEVIDGDDTQLLSASSNLEHAPDTGEPVEVLPPATIRGPFLSIPTKNLSAAEVSHSAASRDPSETGQPATIEEPFSSIATNDILNKDSAPSPQAILRGLIRDAHQHMMYFTLAHSHFTLDDLRDGLDYAYSMLQAATSKRSLLRMLRDDTVHMNTAELRSWITRVDHLDDPLTGYEPRMSVVFESVSPVEMKLAIAEFIESRRTVEDEFKQMRVLLMKRVVAGEKSMQCKISSDNGSVGDGDEAETIMLTGEVPDAWDDSWDGLVTVTMLITLALIYLCVRE